MAITTRQLSRRDAFPAKRDTPRLAVLTASHDRIVQLRRLHRSLNEQSVGLDWLHVIVDDASDPPISPQDIDGDEERIAFERLPRNEGPLRTRNRAIEIALSRAPDLVAFVDDDDYVTPDFFEYVCEMWKNYPDIGWYVSRCRFVDSDVPNESIWPPEDGIYDWFDDMQIHRRFGADVMHVISADRLSGVRFSRYGRYQREWTFLARLARKGGFHASDRITKISSYVSGGITLTPRGIAPDFVSCWNYLAKPAVLAAARPMSRIAWSMFGRQLVRFPVRLAWLMGDRFNRILGLSGKG